MSDLEDIRKGKLEQLQEQHQLQQQIQTLEITIKQCLTKDALQRFGNIKAADPEKAVQLMVVLGKMIQSQNIQQINDEQLKQILMMMNTQKKEFKIKRK